jgi:hypothetical protein
VRDHRCGAGSIKVSDQSSIGVEREGAYWHFNDKIGGIAARLASSCACSARLRLPARAPLVEREVADFVRRFEDY